VGEAAATPNKQQDLADVLHTIHETKTKPTTTVPVTPLTSEAEAALKEAMHQHPLESADTAAATGEEGEENEDSTTKAPLDLSAFIGKDTCLPQDIDELQAAVEDGDCPLVLLTNPDPEAYMLMDMNEIWVKRHVRVMGHPAYLPTIDAMMGMRAFTVMEGMVYTSPLILSYSIHLNLTPTHPPTHPHTHRRLLGVAIREGATVDGDGTRSLWVGREGGY
jgi:hypothetical protein